MITSKLSDNEDIKRQIRSFYGKANMLLCTILQFHPSLCFYIFNLILELLRSLLVVTFQVSIKRTHPHFPPANKPMIPPTPHKTKATSISAAYSQFNLSDTTDLHVILNYEHNILMHNTIHTSLSIIQSQSIIPNI